MANNNKTARGANRKAGNEKKLTPEEKRVQLAKELKLRPKTKEFVDKLIDNPKMSQTEAYIQTHSTNSRDTAKVEASKLLTKPNVVGYKQSAVGKAKRRVITLVDSSNESIALKASQDIIDRNEGKAVQKNEHTSQVVEVKLDLTGARIGAHYLQGIQTPVLPAE